MNLRNRISLSLLFALSTVFIQAQSLKKIIIEEQNNPVLNDKYKYLHLPDSINTPDFAELKKYVLSKTDIQSKKEPEIYFVLMEWVSKQWQHNGWHAAPDSLNALGILKSAHEDGQVYRCVEYGVVLNDILNAFGYPARTVGLKHINTDYGGAGMGHVATEVWSNSLNKWIFLDPQFGIYAVRKKTPLNIYEIYKIKSDGKFKEIDFIELAKNKSNKKYGESFLTNYLGYVDIKQTKNDLNYSLALKMEGKRNFLTFQAFPSKSMVFTNESEDVYFKLNQTMLVIGYTDKEVQRAKSEYSKLKIKSSKDFNENMPLFSARPELVLTLDNNMPWFKSYRLKLNGKLVNDEKGKYCLSLSEGLNTIEAVAINQNNIEGIPTIIKISYK